MANSISVNQGTQTPILTDNTGGTAGTLIGVVKLSTDAAGTFTSLWNGNVGINAGTINTLGTLPNLPGGSIAVTSLPNITQGSINVTAGTINTGTINAGSIVVTAGTIPTLGTMGTLGLVNTVTTVSNLSNGSIKVTAGTEVVTSGSISVIAGTVNAGTINVGTMVGKDANAAAQTGNPFAFGGTDSGGTIRTALVDASGRFNIGTLSVLPNIPGGTLGNVGTIPGIGTITNIGSISSIGTMPSISANPSSGTLNTLGTIGSIIGIGGTVQVSGASAGTFVNISTGTLTALPNLPGGSIAVTAGTINIGTVSIRGIDSGGTLHTLSTDTGGTLNVNAAVSISGGTTNVGTVNTGTINIGTFVGKDANAVAQTGNPISIGGTDSGGTVRTVLVDNTGAMKVSGASAGTNVNLVTGTLNLGTVTISNTPNIGSIAAATVVSLPNLPQGSINVTAGTIATMGTMGTLGLVNTVTTVSNISNGSLHITAGTEVITSGSIAVTAGTINTGTINAGTMQINPLTAANTISNVGTSGTVTIGTLLDTGILGAGTAAYITYFSILGISGTPECTLAFGTQTNGPQVIYHGLIPAGGGITVAKMFPHGYGTTNSPLTYQINSGAGSVSWSVDYFAHT